MKFIELFGEAVVRWNIAAEDPNFVDELGEHRDRHNLRNGVHVHVAEELPQRLRCPPEIPP